MSAADRAKWIRKIWKTEKMESHANREAIEILRWYPVQGHKPQTETGLKSLRKCF